MKDRRLSRSKQVTSAGCLHWFGYVWALLLPLSVYWPLASSVAPEVLDIYARPGVYLSDLAVSALFLVSLSRSETYGRRWGYLRLTVPLLTLVAFGLLTAPMALSPALAGYMALRWLMAVGAYLAMMWGRWSLEGWVTVFLFGLALQVLIGLGQVIQQGPLGLPGELALQPSVSGASILTVGGRRWLRAYGLTLHPNVLGGFLAAGLLLGLPLLNRRRTQFIWWLLGLGLLLSFSRSAWLATAVVLPPLAGWIVWRQPSLRRPLFAALAGAVLLLALAGVLLAGQLTSRLHPTATATEFRSLSERGTLIAVALDIITDCPLTGVGAGNFTLAMRTADTSIYPQPVHNVPLLLAAEVGVIGAGLWFWLWLTPGLALDHLQHDSDSWLVVLVGVWFAWGVISLWDDYPWALNVGRLFSASLLGLISRLFSARTAVPGGGSPSARLQR